VARYHGKGGTVYLSTTGSGTAVAAVSLSSWSIDKATDKVDVTSFLDANKTYVQGLADVKGSFSGYFDSSDDSLFDASESSDGIKLYLYPSSTAPTIYHYGPAWLDGSMEVSATGAVTIKGSFVANGAWGRKP